MTNDLDSGRIQTMVRELLTERFDISSDKMTDDTSIRDLGLDSMLMLDIMLEMEDRLGVKLAHLAMPYNPTLRDVVTVIAQNLVTQT